MRGGEDMLLAIARRMRAKERAAAAVAWCRKKWPDDDPMDHIDEAKRKFGCDTKKM